VPDVEMEEYGGERTWRSKNGGESGDWRRAGRQGYCEETTSTNHARETRGHTRFCPLFPGLAHERKNSAMVLSLFL
jgi:hypothetical protein